MAKVWTNHNVLFVHAKLDDSAVPYHPMRVLAHLRRRLGKKKSGTAAGVRRMSKVCRMNGKTVEEALYWLEQYGFVKIERKAGKLHQYEFMLNRKELYIDHRLDDFGLTATQLRVLCHTARLANEGGEFFLSVKKFAKICGMKRETVNAAFEALEDQGFFTPYAERKNPMYILTLDELFPKPTGAKTTNSGMPDSTNGGAPETGNSSDSHGPSQTSTRAETGNTLCPIRATPLPETSNGGVPETGNERFSFLKQSKEDYPGEDNPASFVNSIGRTPHSRSLGAISETSDKHPVKESPDEQITRVAAKFGELLEVDVHVIGTAYKAECERNGGAWNNKIFERRVGQAVDEHLRSAHR